MVALTHTRADTEIVVAVVVVELSLERHRGLSSDGDQEPPRLPGGPQDPQEAPRRIPRRIPRTPPSPGAAQEQPRSSP